MTVTTPWDFKLFRKIESQNLVQVSSNEKIRTLQETLLERDGELSLLSVKMKELELEIDAKTEKIAEVELKKSNSEMEIAGLQKKIDIIQTEAAEFFKTTSATQREAQQFKDKVDSQKENLLLQITEEHGILLHLLQTGFGLDSTEFQNSRISL